MYKKNCNKSENYLLFFEYILSLLNSTQLYSEFAENENWQSTTQKITVVAS